MIVDVAPVTVVADTAQTIDLSLPMLGTNETPCEIKLQNESPLTLQVVIGDDIHRLGAWMADKLPLCGQRHFQLVPTQIQSPDPAVPPSSQVLVTVATGESSIPGTFPAPLGGSRMTNTQQPQKLLTTFTVPPGTGSLTKRTVTVDPGAHAIGLVFTHLLGPGQTFYDWVGITGHQSGATYYISLDGSNSGQLMVPIQTTADTSYDIAMHRSDANVGNETVYVSQILDAAAVYVVNPADDVLKVSPAGNVIWTVNAQGFGPGGSAFGVRVLAPDYEGQGTSAPAVGTQASVVLAASPGFRYRATFLSASIGQTAAVAQNAQALLKDGATVIHTRQLYITATAQTVQGMEASQLALAGTAGQSMTWQFGAVVASVAQAVTIGAYLQP